MSFFRLPVALAVIVVGLSACDTASTGDGAPAPIPAAAFSFDPAIESNASARSAAGPNFVNAAARVGIVSLAVKAHLVLPSIVTAAATQVDPVVVEGTWIWSSTRLIEGEDVTFRLEGTPDGSSVDWQLRISTADPETGDPLDDFVLYTAETALDGSSGSWRLYYDIEGDRTEVLRADFDVDGEDDRELTFTVTHGDIEGSSVRYRATGDTGIFDWTRQPEGIRTLVEWDEDTLIGFLEADDYNDGARACWDADYNDAACEGV